MVRVRHGVQRTRDPASLVQLLSKGIPTCRASWNERGSVNLGIGAIGLSQICSQFAEHTQVSKRAAIGRPGRAIYVHSGGLSKGPDRCIYLPRVAVDEIIKVANDSASRAIRQHRRVHDRSRTYELLIPQRVEECLVFLDRTAQGEIIALNIPPVPLSGPDNAVWDWASCWICYATYLGRIPSSAHSICPHRGIHSFRSAS